MKKLLIVLVALQLSGCAVYETVKDSLFMAPYDNNEYMLINKIRTIAKLGSCDTGSMNDLYSVSLELKNYSQYLPHNDKTLAMDENLFKIVEELHNKKDPSAAYCTAKLNIIGSSAETIQKSVGARPR
jgi:hypothetical protein